MAALLSGAARPSRRRSSYHGLGPSEFKLLGASHRRSSGSRAIERLAIMSQAITSPTLASWAAALKRGEIAFRDKKNNSSIGEKPTNLVETEEENRCRKSQVHLAFLLPIVNQFSSRLVEYRVTNPFAIYYRGQVCIDLDGDHTGHRPHVIDHTCHRSHVIYHTSHRPHGHW